MCAINTDEETTVSTFFKLFSGHGYLTGEYEIQLIKDAVPHVLTTLSQVPLPLMKPVINQTLEREGIISKVECPTNWCAGILVLLKPIIRRTHTVCAYLSHFNKSIQ